MLGREVKNLTSGFDRMTVETVTAVVRELLENLGISRYLEVEFVRVPGSPRPLLLLEGDLPTNGDLVAEMVDAAWEKNW